MEAIIADPGFQIFSVLVYSHALPASPPNTISAPGFERFYLLSYHLDLLLAAAKDLNWFTVITKLEHPDALSTLAMQIDNHISTEYATSQPLPPVAYRVRLAFPQSGDLQIMSEALPAFSTETSILFPTPLPPPSFFQDSKVVINDSPSPTSMTTLYNDNQPTIPSVLTLHFTTYRLPYNEARERVGISQRPFSEAEVLLVNAAGEIIEGGFTTPYFWRLGHGTGEWGWVTPAAKLGGKLGVTRRWALEWGGVKEGIVKFGDLIDGEEVWLSAGVWGFTKAKILVNAEV